MYILLVHQIRPEISNINLTPPRTQKEETLAESVLHNTMQTLASEFKRTREPKIQNSEVALFWHFTRIQVLDAGHRVYYKGSKS